MTRFIVQLNDGGYINVRADRMVKEDDMICAYLGAELVAMVDISVILAAHLSERGEK